MFKINNNIQNVFDPLLVIFLFYIIIILHHYFSLRFVIITELVKNAVNDLIRPKHVN